MAGKIPGSRERLSLRPWCAVISWRSGFRRPIRHPNKQTFQCFAQLLSVVARCDQGKRACSSSSASEKGDAAQLLLTALVVSFPRALKGIGRICDFVLITTFTLSKCMATSDFVYAICGRADMTCSGIAVRLAIFCIRRTSV